MIGLGLGETARYLAETSVALPATLGWDTGRFPISVTKSGAGFRSTLDPRGLVDPGIWTGTAIHVDGANGADGNSGLGAQDGDFSNAKRTIHAAFAEGNLTGAPYRVIVAPGTYEESAFTRNGNEEPSQPVAVIGWNGPVRYRTGPFSVTWSDAGDGTWSAGVSAVRRVFRTDLVTERGLYSELT